jgi:hypothetical protein
MPNVNFIQRMVNLAQRDFDTVWSYADENDFGGKGFSRALRCIIREWEAFKEQQGQEETVYPEDISISFPPQ